MLHRISAAVCATAAVCLLAVSGCGRPSTLLPSGSPAPKIEAEGWVNGSAPADSDLAGRVLVIDVWAYWCGPCRAQVPTLLKTYQKYKDRGVVFVGLTYERADTLPQIEAFINETGMTWPTGYGAYKTLDALGVHQFPTLVVVGANQQVVWHDELGGDLSTAIDQALSAVAAK